MHHFDEKLIGITSLGERGQVVIPVNIREDLNLKQGDRLFVFAKHKHFIGLVKVDEISGMLKKMISKIERLK